MKQKIHRKELFLVLGPVLQCSWYIQWCCIENGFAQDQQVSKANSFLVRVGPHVHFTLSVLKPHHTWVYAGLMHAATISLSSYLHQPSCVWKILLSCRHPSPLPLNICLPLQSLSLQRRSSMKLSHSGLSEEQPCLSPKHHCAFDLTLSPSSMCFSWVHVISWKSWGLKE